MISGFECLELQHSIISIFGSRVSEIYFLVFVQYSSYIKKLIYMQAREGSCSDGT